MTINNLIKYEYGAMSSKYELYAPNKLTAYAAMCIHFNKSAHLIAIYSPLSCKQDTWLDISGKILERLDEIFGGEGSFDKYLNENTSEIYSCCKTIKKVI